MNNGFGDDFQEVYAPQPQRGAGNWLPLILLLSMAGLLLLLCGGGLLVLFVPGGDLNLVRLPKVEPDPPPEVLARQSIEAYSRAEPEGDAAELEAVRELFRHIARAAESRNRHAFIERFDAGAHLARMYASGYMKPLPALQAVVYRRDVEKFTDLEIEWSELRVMGFYPNESRDWAVVHVLCGSGESGTPMRWFILHDGREWLAADWEYLENGLSLAAIRAVVEENATPQSLTLFEKFDEAMSATDSGESERAERVLERLEAISLPPPLSELRWTKCGFIRRSLGHYELAEQCFRNVRQPDRAPDSWLGLFHAEYDHGRYDEALAALDRYESLVGRPPMLCHFKAECLDTLGRNDEAEEYWRHLLLLEPGHIAGLNALASFEETDDAFIARFPELSAEKIYEVAYSTWKAPIFRAAAEELDRRGGEKYRAAVLHGEAFSAELNYAAAAEKYWEAIEAAEEQPERRQAQARFLDASIYLGDPWAAYQRCPDAEGAFENFVSGIKDEEAWISAAELPRLIALHRGRAPRDPLLPLMEAWLWNRQGKWNAVVEQLNPWLNEHDEHEWSWLARQLLCTALVRLDRWREAAALEAEEEIPYTTAERLLAERRFAELKLLLEESTDSGPEALLRYRAEVLLAEEDSAAALKLLREQGRVEDNWWIGWIQRRAIADSKNPAAELAAEGWPSELSDSVIQELINRGESARAHELLTAFASRDNAPPSWRSELALAVAEEDDEAILRVFRPKVVEALRDSEIWSDLRHRETGVRAALRLGRLEEAERLARDAGSDEADPNALLLALIAQRKINELTELLASIPEQERYAWEVLLDDEEVGPILWEEEFAELRRTYPLRLPTYLGGIDTTLLLEDAAAIDSSWLMEKFKAELPPETQLAPFPSTTPGEENWLIEVPEGFVVFTCARRPATPYFTDREGYTIPPEPELGALLARHNGSLALSWIARPGAGYAAKSPEIIGRLAAALAEAPEVLAVHRALGEILEGNSAEFREELRNNPRRRQTDLYGVNCWLELQPAEGFESYSRQAEQSRLGRRLGRVLEADPEAEIEAEVEMWAGATEERVTVRISACDDSGWATECIGTPLATPLLTPYLPLEESLQFSAANIVAVRCQSKGDSFTWQRPTPAWAEALRP